MIYEQWDLTCADCNGLHELVSPGVGSHHQSQVGLLDQLVHGALQDTTSEQESDPSSESTGGSTRDMHELHHMMAVPSRSRLQRARHHMVETCTVGISVG